MEIPVEISENLIAIIGFIVAWGVAYIQTQKKNEAKQETVAVTEFYTDGNVKPPEGVIIPARSYKMNQETKDFIMHGESEPDKVKMLEQISAAEDAKKTEYIITYSKGYYKVQWGLVYGSARWG